MEDKPDPMIRCAVERRGEGLALLMIDEAWIEFRKREGLDELVRRERLTIISRCELRTLSAKYAPKDWKDLLELPQGRDSDDVILWKRVARLQERFQTHGPSSTWWARFCACNSAATCMGILDLLRDIAREYADREMDDDQAIDWLDLLRQSISSGAGTDLHRLRVNFRKRHFGSDS